MLSSCAVPLPGTLASATAWSRLEGEHLVEEALRRGMLLKTVFLSERRAAPAFLPQSLEVLRLEDELFRQSRRHTLAPGDCRPDAAPGAYPG